MAAPLPVVVAAIIGVLTSPPSAAVLAGALVFSLAAIAAEFKPVPLDEQRARKVSLAFVFLLAAQIIFGWELGVLAADRDRRGRHRQSRPLVRCAAFNACAYALSVLASAMPAILWAGTGGRSARAVRPS